MDQFARRCLEDMPAHRLSGQGASMLVLQGKGDLTYDGEETPVVEKNHIYFSGTSTAVSEALVEWFN